MDREMHAEVERDVQRMFEGKSSADLQKLRGEIEDRIRRRKDASGRADDDANQQYWRGVVRALNVYESRAKLRELHVHILEKSLEKLDRRRVSR
jgi:hypothetical protein